MVEGINPITREQSVGSYRVNFLYHCRLCELSVAVLTLSLCLCMFYCGFSRAKTFQDLNSKSGSLVPLVLRLS